MYPMRNHDVWIYVRCANSDPRIAFDRLYDLIDEAAGHGFLVRGTSFDHCSGNTLKDRIGLRTMLDAVENGRVEAVMVRDLEQISRNSYILVGVIEILRQNDVYLITTECDLNAELINSGLERFVGDRFTRASFGKPRFDVRLPSDGSILRCAHERIQSMGVRPQRRTEPARIGRTACRCYARSRPARLHHCQLLHGAEIRHRILATGFVRHMQCGCCGERLYWRPKTEQWFCRQCGMWTKPIQEKELSDAITIKLEWIQRHSEVIRSPTTQRNVQSVKAAKLAREIQTDLLETEPNADALIAKILRRAELEYEFCSAGDADPATMQIRKACAEYDLTDGFPYTFYKEVVSKVILYRDTHIEVRLQNGQIV